MGSFATLADIKAIEAEMPWADRGLPRSIHECLSRTAAKHGTRPAISYQLTSAPTDLGETLSWAELHGRVTQTANLFRSLGVGERDVVAYVLPNCTETVQVPLPAELDRAGVKTAITAALKRFGWALATHRDLFGANRTIVFIFYL